MAETLLSPGYLARENDQSQITQGPITAGAAIVGQTVKGPVNTPTLVTSYSSYLSKFGGTFISGGTNHEYLTSISAYNYFQQGGTSLLVTRVVNGEFSPATSSISNSVPLVLGTYSSASFTVVNSSTGSWNNIKINATTVLGDINYTITNYPYAATGSFFESDNTTYIGLGNGTSDGTNVVTSIANWAGYVVNAINNGSNEISQHFSASYSGGSLIFTSDFPGTVYNSYELTSSFGIGTPLSTNFAGGTDSTPSIGFVIETLSSGVLQNSYSAPGVNGALLSGSDENLRFEIVGANTGSGTFSLLIRRGNDNNNSKVILESWANLSLDPNSPNYIESIIGNQVTDTSNGYTDVTGDYTNKSAYIRVKTVNNTTVNYFDNNGTPVAAYTSSIPVNQTGSFGGASGVLGGIYNLPAVAYTSSLNLLSNSDEFKYNVITIPGVTNADSSSAVTLLMSNTINRGDAIAIIDLTGESANIATAVSQANGIDNSYTATYYPWLQVIAPNTGKLTWVPPSTIIPSAFAYNDRVAAPWWAPAGFTRGGLNVIQAKRKLSPSDRDTLYQANINSIGTFPGQGVVAYGQKTLQKKASALESINVRRLLIELKSYIGQIANTLVFEQNTNATRNRFLAQTNPYLESVKQRQGLYSYKVVMDETNNTADVIDRNQLYGQVWIQPTKTAEYIILDFNVTPTGATF